MSSPTSTEPKIHKDELKAAKSKSKQRNEIISYTEKVLFRMLEKPTLWNDPAVSNTRGYIEQIRNDRVNFPDKSSVSGDITASTDVSITTQHTNIAMISSTTTPNLSEKFIKQVYDCSVNTQTDLDYVPVLQIINHEIRNRSFYCYVQKKIVSVKSITLTALDKSGYHIPLKLSTQVHQQYLSGLIQKGTIVEIPKFTALYFEYTLSERNNTKPTNVLVLVLALKIIGHFDPVFSDNFVNKKQLSINFSQAIVEKTTKDSTCSFKRKFEDGNEDGNDYMLTQAFHSNDDDNDNQLTSGK